MRCRVHSLWQAACSMLMLFLLASATAFAIIPSAPDSLMAWANTGSSTTIVTLQWFHDNSGPPTHYNIYKATGSTTNTVDFSSAGTLLDTLPNYTIERFNITGLSSGTYSFYVTAVNGDGESSPSNFVVLNVTNTVTFMTYPPTTDSTYTTSGTYSYNAHAITNSGSNVRYVLDTKPDGMTVNATTGVVSWTPPGGGTYRVVLRAYLEDNPSIFATQDWEIRIPYCTNPITISGTVSYLDNTIVSDGYVIAIKNGGLDGRNYQTIGYVNGNGTYTVQVDAAGDYSLFVRGSKFWQTAYYASFPDTSSGPSSITVSCGGTVTANFHVEQQIFTVTGRVTRQSDNAGILGMRVMFMSAHSTSGVESDTNGYYSIDLLKGYTYTVMAQPRVGDGYVAQYYDHVADEASATPILLYSDKTNINFSLAARPNYDNSISGALRDSSGRTISGSVVLYQVSSVNNEYESPRTITTDSANGSFSFANLAPGVYVLMGTPVYWDSTMYAPGYYKEADLAVSSWQDATQITVGSTDNVTGTDIWLRPISGAHGSASLSGTITTDKSRSLKGHGSSIQSAEPVANVLVTAIDENNRISGYTYTDAGGHFELRMFAKGTYTVVADKVGYKAIRRTETFTEDGVTRKSDLTLKVEGTSGVPVVAGPVTVGTMSAWPNPATSQITLRFAATEGTARISIVDALGRQVASTAVATGQGDNEIALAIGGLSTGLYMVQVESGSLRTTTPIRIVR